MQVDRDLKRVRFDHGNSGWPAGALLIVVAGKAILECSPNFCSSKGA